MKILCIPLPMRSSQQKTITMIVLCSIIINRIPVSYSLNSASSHYDTICCIIPAYFVVIYFQLQLIKQCIVCFRLLWKGSWYIQEKSCNILTLIIRYLSYKSLHSVIRTIQRQNIDSMYHTSYKHDISY